MWKLDTNAIGEDNPPSGLFYDLVSRGDFSWVGVCGGRCPFFRTRGRHFPKRLRRLSTTACAAPSRGSISGMAKSEPPDRWARWALAHLREKSEGGLSIFIS